MQAATRLSHPLSYRLKHRLIISRYRPSTVAEATTGVLVGPTRSLHHAVEGYMADDDDSHR
ncbi:hypothetical protein BH20ACT18_BH20ACT18_05810 [soil metagenome]